MKFKVGDKVRITKDFFQIHEDWCQKRGISRDDVGVVTSGEFLGEILLENMPNGSYDDYWCEDYLELVKNGPNHPLTKIFL